MNNDSGMDTGAQQGVVSEERLDLIWKLLRSGARDNEHTILLERHGLGCTSISTCQALQLSHSDLIGLIQHRRLNWRMLASYASCHAQLLLGPILLGMDLAHHGYPYILSFDHISLYMVEELRQVDGSDHFRTTLQTLSKLYAPHSQDPTLHFTLLQPTEHFLLLQEFNIQLSSAELNRHHARAMDNPNFARWIVENVSTLSICRAKFSSEAWSAFCKSMAGATSKVTALTVIADLYHPPPPFSPSLADTIKKASKIKTLNIEVSKSGEELEPFLDESFHNNHILHLTVTGKLKAEYWLSSLSAIVKSDQFASIDYFVSILQPPDCRFHHQNHDPQLHFFGDDDRESIIKLIDQAKSLKKLCFDTGGSFGPEFQKQRIEPIFKERKFQKQALEIAPTLKNSSGLLGRFICHVLVHTHPDVLFGILRVNTAPLKALWDGGRDNRIALLEQSIERSMRKLEAARASKKQKVGE